MIRTNNCYGGDSRWKGRVLVNLVVWVSFTIKRETAGYEYQLSKSFLTFAGSCIHPLSDQPLLFLNGFGISGQIQLRKYLMTAVSTSAGNQSPSSHHQLYQVE
jgi:hypothetical protein